MPVTYNHLTQSSQAGRTSGSQVCFSEHFSQGAFVSLNCLYVVSDGFSRQASLWLHFPANNLSAFHARHATCKRGFPRMQH